LLDDIVERTSPHSGVALDPSDQSDVGIGIDKYLNVAEIADTGIDEQQDAVNNDHVGRLDVGVLGATEVGYKVILRLFDRPPIAECSEMLAEKIVIEGVGVIPVQFPTLIEDEIRKVFVVRVHVDEYHRRCSEEIGDILCDSGLAGAGPSGDSDHQRLCHCHASYRSDVWNALCPNEN